MEPSRPTGRIAYYMATHGISADDIAEKLFQKLASSRRRPFAPSADEDKAGDGLWNAYLDAVEDEDKASAESWNGSTTGILTFVRVLQLVPRVISPLRLDLIDGSLRCNGRRLRDRELQAAPA